MLEAADFVNKNQRQIFLQKIYDRLGEDLSGKVLGIWGLSFKPKTNDMREAPSITIINELLSRGAMIQAFDPKAFDCARAIWGDKIIYSENSYAALKDADAMVLLTEWNEFRRPDFEKIGTLLKSKIIFDGRNQYNAKRLQQKGFEYYQIGKDNAV